MSALFRPRGSAAPSADAAMPLTGERTVPGPGGGELLVPPARGRLPAAARPLRGSGRPRSGLWRRLRCRPDRRCRAPRRRPRLRRVGGRPRARPLPARRHASRQPRRTAAAPTSAVDVVVNFQVIEHLWDQGQFVGGMPPGAAPERRAADVDAQPHHLLPGPRHPDQSRSTRASSTPTNSPNCSPMPGFAIEAMLGVFHGARLDELDARHGGSIIDAQIARALADAPWPADLLADVASVITDDFDLLDASSARHRRQPRPGRHRGAAVTASPSRVAPLPAALHPRPAHPPALAGAPRPLAGRRGMAVPVVGGGVPAADAGAAHARRRGSAPPRHARHDPGGHRPARRPVLPRRHAALAGELAAARARGGDQRVGSGREHRLRRTGSPARVRDSRVRRGRTGPRGARGRRGATAAAPCCAS